MAVCVCDITECPGDPYGLKDADVAEIIISVQFVQRRTYVSLFHKMYLKNEMYRTFY